MYWYNGVFLNSDKDVDFVTKIESLYDVGTLKFKSKDSLLCHLEYEGAICSDDFDCKTLNNKNTMIEIAEENRLGVSW